MAELVPGGTAPAGGLPGAFGEPMDGPGLIEMTGADGHGGDHAEPTLLGLPAETWVYVSIAIFLVLAVVVGKLPQQIAAALDARIASVRRQLDEAKALRAEAEALLADAHARAEAAAKDAAAVIARAESEAATLIADREKAAQDTIARRTAAAEARIEAAERSAETALRADVARRVTAAAGALIAERADKAVQDRLTEDAIAGLDRRLH